MYKTASSLRNENYENENTSITSTKAIRHFNFNNIFPSSLINGDGAKDEIVCVNKIQPRIIVNQDMSKICMVV